MAKLFNHEVPKQCDAYLKNEILDILVQWSKGEIGAGIAYELIVYRAAIKDTDHG